MKLINSNDVTMVVYNYKEDSKKLIGIYTWRGKRGQQELYIQ